MLIDCYGFPAASVSYQNRKLEAIEVSEEGNDTYICFRDTPVRVIHRVRKTASENARRTVIGWAVGAWDDRTALDYIPLNQPLEVTEWA